MITLSRWCVANALSISIWTSRLRFESLMSH